MEILAYIDITLLSLLLIVAVAIVVVRNLLISTIFLSIYSLLMAALYLVLKAPDVAITEAAIGAGISTILFLSVILITGESESKKKHIFLPFIVVFMTAIALLYATFSLYAFGDASAPANLRLAPYYLQESGAEMGIPNVVTSVLASYRGFDTLGETFVVFTAAIAVLLLLGGDKAKKEDE